MLGTARRSPPAPAPTWMRRSLSQAVNARVEVVDAESGAFVPGAEVSVVWPGGSVTKTTDAGGNAAFGGEDFARGGMPGGIGFRDLSIEVQKAGYVPTRVPFAGGQVVSVALVLEPWWKRIPMWGWAAGAIGAGLILTWIIKRK